MKKILFLCFALVALCSPLALRAQDSVAVSPTAEQTQLSVSLADARRYAVKHNRSLQNASLEVQKAHAQRWQTIAALLPQADGTASYVNMFDHKMPIMGMEVPMPSYVQHSVSASIALNGQAIVGALLSTVAIEMQDISRLQEEQTLNANVVQSYVSVLVMQDIVNLLDSSLANISQLAEMTQNSVDVGAAEQTSADLLKVKVNTLRNSINSNKRTVELSYNALRVLLGVDPDTKLILTDKLDDILNSEEALAMMLEDYNIGDNYSYQLLEKNVDVAKKNVVMAGLAYAPTVAFAYQYTAKKYMSDASTAMNTTPPHLISLNVSIPLWSSGKRAAGVTEKKIALQEAENTLAETKDNLIISHQQLCFNLSNAYETYQNEKENLEVTKRVFANTTNKFKWGASSSLEMTNASNDLISAQSSYVQAVLTFVKSEVELAKFLNKTEIIE